MNINQIPKQGQAIAKAIAETIGEFTEGQLYSYDFDSFGRIHIFGNDGSDWLTPQQLIDWFDIVVE